MSTISGTTINHGITLGTTASAGTYTSPLTITATGAVEAGISYETGIYGPAGNGWTVDNAGLIEGQPALYIRGIGTVINSGTIAGTGTGHPGVGIYAGGSVGNTGLIEGENAVEIAFYNGHGAGPGTVTNSGTIVGTGTHGSGVSLDSGGSVGNTGLIEGRIGVQINYAAGVVTNSGTILGTSGGVTKSGGGTIVNHGRISATNNYGAGILLAGGETVSNFGTISDNAAGSLANAGILFVGVGGGRIVNGQAGSALGLIAAYHTGIGFLPGTGANQAAVTVVNYGTIQTYAAIQGTQTVSIQTYAGSFTGFAVEFDSVGTVDNFGTIVASQTAGGGGVLLTGGLVTNEAGAIINGAGGSAVSLGGTSGAAATVSNSGIIVGYFGVSINTADTASNTIVNFGTIVSTATGNYGEAVYLGAGGIVTNYGTISGSHLPNTTHKGAIQANNAGATVINFGTVINANANGINLARGGLLVNGATNATGALVAGDHGGIYMGGWNAAAYPGAAGTVVNYGTIGNGIALRSGGTVTNRGLITGGIFFGTTAGTVGNYGAIQSTSAGAFAAGVYLENGGAIANAAGASITDLGAAVSLGVTVGAVAGYGMTASAATVTNSGLLAGSVGIAIGAGDTGSNTIANYGTIASSSGTAISLGTVGNELVVIGSTNSSLQGVIANLLPGDRVDLPFLTYGSGGSYTLNPTTHVLQVTENSTSFNIGLDPNESFAGDVFQLSTDSGTGTLITEAVCFCRGTLILTDEGEVPVEILAVGDRVRTLSGAFKPIRWIGFGRDLVTRRNSLARPIVVRAGALADSVPRRDLYLTHGHSLYLDGFLIPVEHLVNHRSILWDESARVVEYYHIELEDHDVVFAEGAPAESYHDAGNRALFHNARDGSAAGAWKPTFAPVLNDGDIVGRVWADLYERAGGQIERDTSDDPDLHLILDGERLDPVSVADGVYTFALAAPPAGPLRLRSRSAVPSLTGISRHDHRRLGVAIRQIILSRPGVMTAVDCDAPLFREGGCHPPENGYCWTDGDFELPARFFTLLNGAFTLMVHTKRHNTRYPIAAPVAQAA